MWLWHEAYKRSAGRTSGAMGQKSVLQGVARGGMHGLTLAWRQALADACVKKASVRAAM